MAVADHFIEDDRLGSRRDRREQAARLDLPSCAGSPIRTSLASASWAWSIRRARFARVDHPGLVDHQHRIGGRGSLAACAAARSNSARSEATEVPASPPSAGRWPPARSGPRPAAPIPLATHPFAAAVEGIGLAGPGLADDDDHALAAAEQAFDHRPLIGLQVGRWRGRGRRRSPRPRRILAGGHDLDRGERLALKLPDGAGGEALASWRSPRFRSRPASARKASASSQTSSLALPPAGSWRPPGSTSRRSKWEAWAVTAGSTSAADRRVAVREPDGHGQGWRGSTRGPEPISCRLRPPRSRRLWRDQIAPPWPLASSAWRSAERGRRHLALPPRGSAGGGWRRRADGRRIEALDLRDAVADLLPAGRRGCAVSSWRKWASAM